ncbi:Vancomycin resistance protein YoaR, contains peptidoglycan-binding and VanW domains [Actinopolymorpha singaporensis]|uniref:Vancomycin resistance protein YoaR, contains peptidoglycan-binding and VanW domains n=1 Tax=Actinopolymorpha singaporensis TaxID=117157 RepID=A0A1H1YUQ6_9ACTN|nr:Vancomycin resistance protein YoaR, contains peptidoglycan-binding and VanW domains [Actinopolymorpha singaporensis]
MRDPGEPGQPTPEPTQYPSAEADAQSAARRGRVIVLATVGVLVVLLGGYALLAITLGGSVPRGTSVGGVDVSGLSRDEAVQRLRDRLAPRAEDSFRVGVRGRTYSLEPAEAGLGLDLPATVDAVYVPRSLNPVEVSKALGGGGDVAPVLTVDHAKLDAAVAGLAKEVRKAGSPGGITFTGGTAKAADPVVGYRLDTAASADRIEQEFLRTTAPIDLPVTEQKPKVGQAEVRRAMREFATPAMSGPVKVRVNDKSFDVSPAEVGAALTMVPDKSGRLAPRLDVAAFERKVADRLRVLQIEPKDASVRMFAGRPTVVPSTQGQTVPPANLARAVVAALPKSGAERVATVRTKATDAKFTTKDAQNLGVKQVVGQFTTYYPHAAYRNTNIGRAGELINNRLIKPGETFSLNGILGERTEANGFAKGFVIVGGRLREELGGGVSQVATTTYNAAFFAGMEDVEHRPHAFYIDRYPVGREATVYWGYLDLKWRNNTPYGVLVQAVNQQSSPGKKGSITVRLWSTKYWTVKGQTSARHNFREPKVIFDEKDGCVPQDGVRGFDVDVTRRLYRGSSLVKTETDHVRYSPEDRVTCGPSPTPTPKQTPTPKPKPPAAVGN